MQKTYPPTLYVKWMPGETAEDGFWFTCDFPMDGATIYRKENEMTIRLWIYTAQMKRMLDHLYPNAVQISAEVFEVVDDDFSGTQDYVGDMCGRVFSVVS